MSNKLCEEMNQTPQDKVPSADRLPERLLKPALKIRALDTSVYLYNPFYIQTVSKQLHNDNMITIQQACFK